VQDFKALEGPNGDQIFLDKGELTKANGYYSDKVGMLYKNAFSTPKSLVLNITNTGVQTLNNVHDHAKKIQTEYENVGCIVFVAKEIMYYPPKNTGHDKMLFYKHEITHKRYTIGDVIQLVDDQDGLDMPLVVIGYSQMIRGDSFRSNCRVPTHMCCALGTCMSIDKMVQAMGRATYSDSKLEQNGFTHVTVLTFANDYDTARAYPVWLQEMNDKIKHGMSIGAALSSSATYTDQANVTFGQNRTIRRKRDNLVLDVCFEDRAKYTQIQTLKDPLMKSLYEVAKDHYALPATDADDATAGRLREHIAISKSAQSDSGKTSSLTALLLQEENQSLLECFRGEGQWHGHGAEAHFEGAPNWRVVIAKLESLSQHLSRELIDKEKSLLAPPASDADDATADRMWEYIAIAKSGQSDSGKTSSLTAILLQEENQSLLECFQGEGQWHGHGAEAHFEGAPNWRIVIAKLESFSQNRTGGTAEEYLSVLRSRSPDLPYDIKDVRAALQKLAAKGKLKSSSVFGPVQRGNARYFIPDTEVL
jgi:hypothetical protein